MIKDKEKQVRQKVNAIHELHLDKETLRAELRACKNHQTELGEVQGALNDEMERLIHYLDRCRKTVDDFENSYLSSIHTAILTLKNMQSNF